MPNELATTQPQERSIVSLMESVIAGGITTDSVGVLERMMALHERNQSKMAEQAFARAFSDLQADMPSIDATKPVPNKDGTVRYKFAPYEEIMSKVKPLLKKHGFSISFNTKWDGPRLVVSCKLLHGDGHSQTNDFAARVGNGPPGANEAQADGAVNTLAKRRALCDALNIVVEHDTDGDDARSLGASITAAQAAEINKIIEQTKPNVANLLAWAHADSVETIPANRFEDVIAQLERFRRKKSTVENPKATDPDQAW